MKNEKYRLVNGKKLRCGYTTGSCATAAATASLEMLLTGKKLLQVEIKLPKGQEAIFDVENAQWSNDEAVCAIIKDGGDDADATHGLPITVKVTKTETEDIIIDGGIGVGRVTQDGLQCKVGEAAINPVPRKMIRENLLRVCRRHGYHRGLRVEVSVPGGEEVGRKTFNPKLGIIGGISILGTTGIVEPMSEKALLDTIKVDIDKRYAENPERILIAPGNYGMDFCKTYLGLDIDKAAEISNFVGEALDYIKYKGFKEVLLVGHTGKLVKIAAGVMNTHSLYADARMEVFVTHSAILGAPVPLLEKMLKCVNTDKAFELVKDMPWFPELKRRICDRALWFLNFRLKDEVKIEVVVFTTDRNNLIKSEGADELIEKIRKDQGMK